MSKFTTDSGISKLDIDKSAPTNGAIVYTPEPIDGAARYATDLVKALRAAGVRVTLFCPKNFEYTQELLESEVTLAYAPYRDVTSASLVRRLWRNASFAVQSAAALFDTMRGGETVHFQNPLHFPLGFLPYCVVRMRRGHIVLTAHDPIPHRWRLPNVLRRIEQAMLGFAYRTSDAIVVHNASGKKALIDVFHISHQRIHVIPHGAVADQQAESDYPEFQTLRLLCFGSIRENKGIHLAIQAVQQLQGRCPVRIELNIRGELYTAAEGRYWNSCLQQVARAPEGIEVGEGFVRDAEITSLLTYHHAVLLPYTDFFSESGVAALALAHGRPVLATKAGGLGEMLDELQCGIAIERPDSESVAKAIKSALEAGREHLYQMGQTGRQNLLAKRSWRIVSQKTAEVYAHLQKSNSPSPVKLPGFERELINTTEADGSLLKGKRFLKPGARPGKTERQKSLRILIHTPEPTSSPALYVGALVGALTDAGTDLVVVCSADHDSLHEFIRNSRVELRKSCPRRIDTRLGRLGKIWRNGYFIMSSCWALAAATRKAAIVNFQYVMHLPFSVLFFLCAWLRGCRIVFTAHDPLPHKWLLGKRLRWIERSALAWMYRVSDVIIVHSEAGKRAILGNFPVTESKVEVIVHGPYKLNAALPVEPESDVLQLLFFGALRENKGVHLAIQAIQQLHRCGVRVTLTIAGRVLNRKEQAYWDNCRKLIDDCPEPIRLMERFVPDEELPELFAHHHCFVLPYGNFHSDSGVAFMALANGRPFLSTNAGGLGQMMEDSKAGIQIESASVKDVEIAIRKAVELGPEKLRAMGAAGEAWVMQECGWPKAASQMQAIFTAVSSDGVALPASAIKA